MVSQNKGKYLEEQMGSELSDLPGVREVVVVVLFSAFFFVYSSLIAI